MPERQPGRTGPPFAAEVSFRPYREGDIPACAKLARQAWPAGPGAASKDIEQAGMEGYMQYSLESSNWADIASGPEGVMGFLFGRIDGYSGSTIPRKSMLGEIPSFLRSLWDQGGLSRSRLGFAWSIFMTDLKVSLKMPRSDAEIEMFIVDSGVQGRGIGSELLDRFLRTAKESGASLVTLYTDELMSNWRFYENRGFKRVATFHDNITSHYSGTEAQGLILSLDLSATTDGGSARPEDH